MVFADSNVFDCEHPRRDEVGAVSGPHSEEALLSTEIGESPGDEETPVSRLRLSDCCTPVSQLSAVAAHPYLDLISPSASFPTSPMKPEGQTIPGGGLLVPNENWRRLVPKLSGTLDKSQLEQRLAEAEEQVQRLGRENADLRQQLCAAVSSSFADHLRHCSQVVASGGKSNAVCSSCGSTMLLELSANVSSPLIEHVNQFLKDVALYRQDACNQDIPATYELQVSQGTPSATAVPTETTLDMSPLLIELDHEYEQFRRCQLPSDMQQAHLQPPGVDAAAFASNQEVGTFRCQDAEFSAASLPAFGCRRSVEALTSVPHLEPLMPGSSEVEPAEMRGPQPGSPFAGAVGGLSISCSEGHRPWTPEYEDEDFRLSHSGSAVIKRHEDDADRPGSPSSPPPELVSPQMLRPWPSLSVAAQSTPTRHYDGLSASPIAASIASQSRAEAGRARCCRVMDFAVPVRSAIVESRPCTSPADSSQGIMSLLLNQPVIPYEWLSMA
ncbi:unnamed protein product [Polarella glacialis]|uniref:Uncharacterized protein n=1 Tax=Polarella glacialis TaxID=89957 RepID=A0A813H3C4_POLGL|nr:unnamed protein product [Polarella glacialis]